MYVCVFCVVAVSEQNAGGSGGSETSCRQGRQEIRERGDGGNFLLGDEAMVHLVRSKVNKHAATRHIRAGRNDQKCTSRYFSNEPVSQKTQYFCPCLTGHIYY